MYLQSTCTKCTGAFLIMLRPSLPCRRSMRLSSSLWHRGTTRSGMPEPWKNSVGFEYRVLRERLRTRERRASDCSHQLPASPCSRSPIQSAAYLHPILAENGVLSLSSHGRVRKRPPSRIGNIPIYGVANPAYWRLGSTQAGATPWLREFQSRPAAAITSCRTPALVAPRYVVILLSLFEKWHLKKQPILRHTAAALFAKSH